jgi:hypothetical protein
MSGDRSELRWATVLATPRGGTRASLALARAAAGLKRGHEPTLVGTARLAGRLAGALTMIVCLIGLVVRAAFPTEARRWLAYPFSGVPGRPSEAATIFLHNSRALAAVGGLLLIAQSPYLTHAAEPGVLHRALQRLGEALLGAAVAANLIVVGVSFGAYGMRMVRAALPHGLVELAAYTLALALYLQGRHRPLPTRQMLAVCGLSVTTLALAALLETFVNP